MNSRFVLFGALLCLLIVSQTSAQCLCAEKGMDFCSCGAAVPSPPPRPAPKLVERFGIAKFPPIGDSCWCGKQLVQPAVPPKPSCKPPAPPSHGCKCSCNCGQPAPAPHGCSKCGQAPPTAPTIPIAPLPLPAPSCIDSLMPATLPAPAAPVPAGVPADPLSISMALTAGKSFAVPEAKLSYGPVAAPLNIIKKVRLFSQVPEEKLYGLNAQIIEFKKKFPQPTKAELLAEAVEEAEEEAAAYAAPQPAPHLTYADLGYGPAAIKNPLFLRLRALAQPAIAAYATAKAPPLTGCGYVPGKVTPAAEYVEQPLGYGTPCL